MADPLDWVTLTEAKTVLRLTSTTANDTELTGLITAVSQRLDEAVGPCVYRDLDETHDGARDGFLTYEGQRTMLQLKQWPIVAITTVTEDGAVLASTEYKADYEKGQLWRRVGTHDYLWRIGRENIQVAYTAGRYASTNLVAERYKQGCYLMLQHMWRSRQWSQAGISAGDFQVPQIAFPAFSVPNAVVEWFGAEWRDTKRGGFA